MMSSFALTESIYFAKENNSKLYVCFLDCKQAFDRVWHDGLFFKLFQKSVDLTTIRCIMSLYNNSQSIVRHNGLFSEPFSVAQGTRQGGVTSPSLYLLYIEDLIKELENSGYGFCIAGGNCSSLSVADDMALLSFSRVGLQAMMNICYKYSLKWRFMYNPAKCSVVVFNESKHAYKRQSRSWTLGTDTVIETDHYIHLGVNVNKYLNFSDNVSNSCKKIRSSLLSLVNVGLHPNGLRSMTSHKIYKCIVVPKALYGCELWPSLSKSKQMQLEQAHRFCIKYILRVPTYSRTDICMSLIGSRNIEYEVDYRKLTFFGQLCRLHTDHVSKRIFLHRFQINTTSVVNQHGFSSEVYRLLRKYGLMNYAVAYFNSGVFPTKTEWKSTLRRAINDAAQTDWYARVSSCAYLYDFLLVKTTLRYPSDLFYLGSCSPLFNSLSHVYTSMICKLFADTFTRQCSKCLSEVSSIIEHVLCNCIYTVEHRIAIYSVVLSLWDRDMLSMFLNLESRHRAITLLIGFRNLIGNDDDVLTFFQRSSRHVVEIYKCL